MAGSILICTLIVFSVTNSVYGDDYCEAEGIKIKIGESAPIPEKCKQDTCNEDKSLSEKGCENGGFIPKEGCELSDINYSVPYPLCCPYQICTPVVYCELFGVKIKQGESATIPERCEKLICRASDTIEIKKCPPLKFKPACNITNTNYSKPYPECCPRLVC